MRRASQTRFAFGWWRKPQFNPRVVSPARMERSTSRRDGPPPRMKTLRFFQAPSSNPSLIDPRISAGADRTQLLLVSCGTHDSPDGREGERGGSRVAERFRHGPGLRHYRSGQHEAQRGTKHLGPRDLDGSAGRRDRHVGHGLRPEFLEWRKLDRLHRAEHGLHLGELEGLPLHYALELLNLDIVLCGCRTQAVDLCSRLLKQLPGKHDLCVGLGERALQIGGLLAEPADGLAHVVLRGGAMFPRERIDMPELFEHLVTLVHLPRQHGRESGRGWVDGPDRWGELLVIEGLPTADAAVRAGKDDRGRYRDPLLPVVSSEIADVEIRATEVASGGRSGGRRHRRLFG